MFDIRGFGLTLAGMSLMLGELIENPQKLRTGNSALHESRGF